MIVKHHFKCQTRVSSHSIKRQQLEHSVFRSSFIVGLGVHCSPKPLIGSVFRFFFAHSQTAANCALIVGCQNALPYGPASSCGEHTGNGHTMCTNAQNEQVVRGIELRFLLQVCVTFRQLLLINEPVNAQFSKFIVSHLNCSLSDSDASIK